MENTLYCLIGPSGCGKSTLAEILEKKYGMRAVASYTTRPMREGETNGVGHIFVNDEEFDALGELVAYTKFDNHRYGITKELLDRCNLYVIDPAGVRYMKERMTDRDVFVFGLDPGPALCFHRMKERGDSIQKVMERITHDEQMIRDVYNLADIMLDATLSPDSIGEQAWKAVQEHESGH